MTSMSLTHTRLYSILFTVCEVAFDNFFIKEFYDYDDDGMNH